MRMIHAIIACVVFAAVPTLAQQASPAATIADVAWLQGYWEGEGSLRFVAKHFHSDWVGWEEKDKALRLRLTARSATEFAFGGVVFRRDGVDALTVEIAMRGKDGAVRSEVLRFTRKPI